jgi:putative tryptophan/tyrosine transport system substrate-binding protein
MEYGGGTGNLAGGRVQRRAFTIAALLASIAPLACLAADKVYKLGILDGGRAPPPGRKYNFVRLLSGHGFEEGKNLSVQVKAANLEYDDLDRLARELVREAPDVIVAMGPSSIAAAASATRTVPIVMMYGGDPVGLGHVSNLSRPGGNITGNGWEQDIGQVAKTFELLKEIAPLAQRIGVIWHEQNKSHPLYMQRFSQSAKEAGLDLVSMGIRRGPSAEARVRELEASPVHALLVLGDYVTFMYDKQFDEVIRRRRLPTLVMGRVAGTYDSAVLFYGPRLSEYPARAAEYIARIFKGARPGDLPVVMPSRWEMALNPRSAAAIGVSVPERLRVGADEIVQ